MLFKNNKSLSTSIVIPKKIIFVAKSLQFISYKLVVNFTDKLFKTPIRFSTPKREEMMWKSAQKKRVKIEGLQKEIDVLSYGYSTKKVLLVHGWSGRSTQLFMVADKLLEKGYMVISFDGPAHGKSEGKESSLPEFITVIQQIHKEFGPFVSAVGHSFGGLTLYNTAKLLNLNSFVSISSPDKISTILNQFIKNLDLKLKTATKLKQLYNHQLGEDVDNLGASKQAKSLTMPVLVVHDAIDGDVNVSCAINIRQNLKNGSLLITQGLGHTKILRDTITMNRIVNFIHTNQ